MRWTSSRPSRTGRHSHFSKRQRKKLPATAKQLNQAPTPRREHQGQGRGCFDVHQIVRNAGDRALTMSRTTRQSSLQTRNPTFYSAAQTAVAARPAVTAPRRHHCRFCVQVVPRPLAPLTPLRRPSHLWRAILRPVTRSVMRST